MKKSILSSIAVITVIFLGLAFAMFPVEAVTSTMTITGYNFAGPSNITNAFFPLILPLMFAEMFGFIMKWMGRTGDFFVTMFLFGFAVGSTIGTLVGQIPFAMSVVSWVIIGIWWWAGGQGEGAEASGDSLSLPRGWT